MRVVSMHKALRAGAIALLLTLLAPHAPALADVPASLQEAAASGVAPAGLVIKYDDLHSFHGGTTIEIGADGAATRRDLAKGQETTSAATLSAEQLKGLLELLVEQRAWEQKTESRLMVPGESKGTLSIHVGDEEAGFWEFYNDMGENDRLSRIKKAMEALVPATQ